MKNLEHRWIEFVEENTIWEWGWYGQELVFGIYIKDKTIIAKSAYLIGHKIAFAKECGYDIISATCIKWKNDNKIPKPFIMDYFPSVWDKFMEMEGE